MVITVTHPHRVTVAVDDQVVAVDVLPTNVRGALAAAGVDLADTDVVSPALDTPTDDGLSVTVTRHSTRTVPPGWCARSACATESGTGKGDCPNPSR